MLCNLCKKHKRQCRSGSKKWIEEPCTTITKASLRKHMASEIHQQAVSLETEMTLSEDGKGIVAALGQQKIRSALTHAARSIYWLIKREIPHITTYTPLLELLELCECPHLIHLNKVLFLNHYRYNHFTCLPLHVTIKYAVVSYLQGGNAHYTSKRFIQEVVDCCADTVRASVLRGVHESPTFSILIDETTDVAIMKQLIVYIRYWEGNQV